MTWILPSYVEIQSAVSGLPGQVSGGLFRLMYFSFVNLASYIFAYVSFTVSQQLNLWLIFLHKFLLDLLTAIEITVTIMHVHLYMVCCCFLPMSCNELADYLCWGVLSWTPMRQNKTRAKTNPDEQFLRAQTAAWDTETKFTAKTLAKRALKIVALVIPLCTDTS